MSEQLSRRMDAAFAPVKTWIDEGRIPGGVLGMVDIHRNSEVRYGGYAQLEPVSRPMTASTWFDLASLTKVIFTTPRIIELHLSKVINLDDPVSAVLQDFRQYNYACWERRVTFRQCLGHLTPFPAVEPLYTYGRDPDLLRAFVLQREWRESSPVYSDINFILLGLVLERIAGSSVRDMPAGPGFAFSADPAGTAATEKCTWRHRVLCGEVHDDNCAALQGAGHAGLFGNASAVLNFAHGLLTGDGYPEGAIELLKTPLSNSRAHGWERMHSGWSGGEHCSRNSLGHTGFTGTGLWVDFDAGLAWTLLTNRIHPTRHANSGIDSLRRVVGDQVVAANIN